MVMRARWEGGVVVKVRAGWNRVRRGRGEEEEEEERVERREVRKDIFRFCFFRCLVV